ncbi:MAG: aspartate aminotransferase family protein [Sphingorhabdus sp.]
MTLDHQELERWDRDNFFHPSTHLGQFSRGEAPRRVVKTAKGATITDLGGNELLDGFAGLYCVNVGYGCQPVIDAIAQQANELAYYHSYVGHSTVASITLSKMILDRAPANMSKVYFGLSGSDANETNIKLIWYYNNILGRPKKKKIISRDRGYHGSGLMSGSLTGLPVFHNKFDLPLSQVLHTQAPYYFRRPELDMTEEEFSSYCAEQLEQLIAREGADTIAAFIGEPALGTGGLVPPPKGYWEKIGAILEKHDILLISDEVVTAFGRLGSMFGSDHYGMKPDLITIAKGLTSAYAPLSGSIVSEKMWKVLEQGTDENGAIGHGWTYSAHPICAAAGVANLQYLDDSKLIENVRDVGPYFRDLMAGRLGNHAHVGEVRGEGLLVAIEFVKDRGSRTFFEATDTIGAKVSAALMKRGVIGRAMPHADIIGFAPPFCLTKDEAGRIVDALAGAVEEVLG